MMSDYHKYEIKTCERCGKQFVCKSGNITQCQCFNVTLSKEETLFIKEFYDDCICVECLIKMKELFKEKKTIQYFVKLKNIIK